MIRKFLYRFDLFFQPRFYYWLCICFGLFLLAFAYPSTMLIARIACMVMAFGTALDLLLLFIPNRPLEADRTTGNKWSLGDENTVKLHLKNRTFMPWNCRITDELPVELQERKFGISAKLQGFGTEELAYFVKPLRRGLLEYGNIRVMLLSPLGLLGRRLSFEQTTKVGVYPSIIQMRKYALYTISRITIHSGIKKLKRIGHSYEFEQIKDYVRGDDLRHINWKATGRSNLLKTNHFVEERSQPVYCVIDKSRVMNLAFQGMTLLDYAINASLVIANTALQKGDRAGLVTFSDRIGSALRADNSSGQLKRILDHLYHEKYRTTEADFEFLYKALRRVINTRSLVFLFTNFESVYALHRVLPVLRSLNMSHLLVVIFFENDELEEYAYAPAKNNNEIYQHVIARQMVMDKRQMAAELSSHGLQCVVSKPSELTINSLNKYLELKAKGLV